MGHGIEKAPDIRIEHPVHASPQNPGMESIQRIVLATPRPEPIGEADEVLLVDRLQHPHDGLLDDLVLQAPDAQGPLRAVGLRDVCPSGRPGAVASLVYPLVQILQLRFEIFPVGPPRHAIDPRRCVTLQCDVALSEQIDGDVMQQRGEPHCLALSRRLAHGCQPVRRGSPARCPDRGRLTAVLLGRGPSLHDLRRGQTLFVQSLRGYYDLVQLLIPVHAHRSAVACMSRSGMPAGRG